MKLAGRDVVVTGGANGIGLEICKCLMREGAKVVSVLDVCEDALREAMHGLRRSCTASSSVAAFHVDVTNASKVVRLIMASVSPKASFSHFFALQRSCLEPRQLGTAKACLCCRQYAALTTDGGLC